MGAQKVDSNIPCSNPRCSSNKGYSTQIYMVSAMNMEGTADAHVHCAHCGLAAPWVKKETIEQAEYWALMRWKKIYFKEEKQNETRRRVVRLKI